MGREFIGECPVSDKGPKFETYEEELAIKYIKQSCGQPPRGVDVEITLEGSEVGNEGDQVSYPIVSVVWDDYITEYPGEYIGKCMEAFERFDLPEEIHERYMLLSDLQNKFQELLDHIAIAKASTRSNSTERAPQRTKTEQEERNQAAPEARYARGIDETDNGRLMFSQRVRYRTKLHLYH